MKNSKRWGAILLLTWFMVGTALAQKPNPAKHEQQVRDMVAFLQYVLNTLGDQHTSARDKDVLVTESYTKIFRDAKVQIEDDLDANRKVITNKDVQAYLKDVDFFFKNVEFEFEIRDIKGEVNANEQLFYKVTLTRTLKGTTADGVPVNNTIPRYIEINFDPADQDLKIVSIYTHEFDASKALKQWWEQLSFEWRSIFKQKLNITSDSVTMADLKDMTTIEALDLGHNEYIQDIAPLSELVNLRVLNLSNTAITDLSPIRNLTELADINLAHTPVKEVSALRYAHKLKTFNISYSKVTSLDVLERLDSLQHLEMAGTEVWDFTKLKDMTSLQSLNLERTGVKSLDVLEPLNKLEELNIAKTFVMQLNGLAGMEKLAFLNIDSSFVTELQPLGALKKLRILSMNYTLVASIQPLQTLPKLEKVYCDHTPITRELAHAFMANKPGVIVIFDSEDLKSWWSTLPPAWQKLFRQQTNISQNPDKDALAVVTSLDSVNLAAYTEINDLSPLQRLNKLHVVILTHTQVTDLSPLKDHRDIRLLDISDTPVNDLTPLKGFSQLEVLYADSSRIEDLTPLVGAGNLKKLFVDKTGVHDVIVQGFLKSSPRCLVVYKTHTLEKWWAELSPEWQEVFSTQLKIQGRESLHALVELERLHFENVPVRDLSPLNVFIRLKDLSFSATGVTDLAPLTTHTALQTLHATSSPIAEITSVAKLPNLEEIDISNTPVDDLEPLSQLLHLKRLNCSGTQVKKLNALEYTPALQYLDCSNTRVKKLDPVLRLPLTTLKCYNTRISNGRVESFKSANPECQVVYYR